MRISRANAVFWGLWLCALVWCYFNAYDDPSSVFFNSDAAFRASFSATRRAEVDAYVRNLPNNAPKSSKPEDESTPASLCIGIPSINRTSSSFLTYALGGLVDTLTPEQRSSIHIVVLLADTKPRQHYAYGAQWLSSMADEVLIYDTDSATANDTDLPDGYRVIPHDLRGVGRGDGRVENMRLDHSLLIETCSHRGGDYFALIEDDVITSRDWYTRPQDGLDKVNSKTSRGKFKDWIYLRLFYSEIFMGWNNEEVPEYMEFIVIIYTVLLGCLALVMLYRRRTLLRLRATSQTKPSPSPSPTGSPNGFAFFAALILGLWTPACIVLIFLAGRITTHRMTLRHPTARPMERYGCCAQGMVFPQRHLGGMLTLFRTPPFQFPGDMILEDYARDWGLSKWALDPSVMQHIGYVESSDGPRKAEVWNFSFERNR